MRRLSRRTILLSLTAASLCASVVYVAVFHDADPANGKPIVSKLRLEDIPFNGARSYGYLKQICDIGPRPSGSQGMQTQQKLLSDHFASLGGKVEMQSFRVRHPLTGEAVTMSNLIVRWHPERRERVLLCAHYDTRPYPDQDRRNPRGTFIGANDGGSGVALLMELARQMPTLSTQAGVDFALFDGEEFVFEDRRDPYFLGSEYFATDYAQGTSSFRYRWGVLLDMVGDAQLQIFYERNSMSWRETRPLIVALWETAKRLGVREFVPRTKYEVNDDHIKLRNVGGIPTCDVIDFEYPYWHTEGDTADKCSALSLAKVGWVVQEWLKSQ